MFSSEVLHLWKLKICRGMFLALETQEASALAMTELSQSFTRIISFSSKLNVKFRDDTLNMQVWVKSLNYLTSKNLHRSQSLKFLIRKRFYWLQCFKKQVASRLILITSFWKDSVDWFWNTLRRVQTVGLLRVLFGFHSHYNSHSLALVQEKATKQDKKWETQ